MGEIVDQLQEKMKQMDSKGHDIACHNYGHLRPTSMETSDYKEQIVAAKKKIEETLGHPIEGYRAPSFAIDDERLRIVEESGFYYDSSRLKPQKSAKYGTLALSGFEEVYPCIYKKGDFMEFEVSTQKIGSMNVLLGGGYMRMLPWFFMKWMTQRYLDAGRLYVMYIHPIDLSRRPIPKVVGCGFDRYLRTHIGRKNMVKRFVKVIDMLQRRGYEFVTFRQLAHMDIQTESYK